MNVLIINGHPREKSLSWAFMDAYAEGAQKAGVNMELLALARLNFNPHVTSRHCNDQYAEPAILYAQQLIRWADHVVFIYPTWWGTMPALLKGFIDRVFVPGFAFEETEAGTGYEPLLGGRTAQVITTMDTPHLIYQLLYRAPGHNAMRRSLLRFCGFQVTRVISFGPVKKASSIQCMQWIEKIKEEGYKLKGGTLSISNKVRKQVKSWMRAIRLQFYPMTFIAYAAGALAAGKNYGFDHFIFWTGYAWIFFLELATVLSNDYFDYFTDKQNKFYGPFTGGSRVIVKGLLSFGQVSKGIIYSLAVSMSALCVLVFAFPHSRFTLATSSMILGVLALGYTVPPLKLSYRGLGEVTVGFTHSFAVIICGYLFQGGTITDHQPWYLSWPLFLAVLPSIILAGIPDREADKAAGKGTLAVRFGDKGAACLALLFTLLSATLVTVFTTTAVEPFVFHGILYGVLPHALLLCMRLWIFIQRKDRPERIDGLLAISLTYLMWFAVVPLVNLF